MNSIEKARRFRVYVWEHSTFDKACDLAELMIKSNANAIRFSGVSQHGNYAFFDSQYFPKHPGLHQRDLLRELANEFKQHRDLHLFPYNSLGYFVKEEVCREHDYRALSADGSFIEAWWAGETGYAVCLNNPFYVEAFAAACVEMVRDYGASGIYFDGPRWGWWGACYCDHCKGVINNKYGYEVSNEVLDEHRGEVREHGYIYSVKTIKEAVQAIRDMPIVFNLNIEERQMLPVMDETQGALVAEAHRGQSSFMKVLNFVKTGAAFETAQWAYAPPGHYNDFVTYENWDTKLFGMMQLAHGSTPIVETMHSYLHDETGVAAVRDLFATMKENEDLFFAYKPVRNIALLYSSQALEGHPEYLDHYKGAFRALTHGHQQFNVILDRDLTVEKLSSYNVLYLAQVTSLNGAQVKAIQGFVRQGGGLIATCETSLYDQDHAKRENFALAELFGADYRGVETPEWVHAYGPRVYSRMTGQDNIIKTPEKARLIAHDYTLAFSDQHHAEAVSNEFLTIESHSDATVLADTQQVVEDPEWVVPDGSFMPPYALETTGPCITAKQCGKGRVIYMAPAMEKLYEARGFVDVLKLIDNAVEWVSANRGILRVDAPTGLLCNLTESGKNWALHLINYTGSINENSVYKVDWVAPLTDINIGLGKPQGKKLKSARLLSTGEVVAWREDNNSIYFKIPVINGYECVLLTSE